MSRLTRLATISLLALAAIATSPDLTATEDTPRTPLSRRDDEMTAGSSCAGSEGQWNCMTSSFQRCGSGQWSDVQQCALGTKCTPSGLTYEFHVDYADGYLGAAPPSTSGAVPTAGGDPLGLVNWWLLSGLGVLVIALMHEWCLGFVHYLERVGVWMVGLGRMVLWLEMDAHPDGRKAGFIFGVAAANTFTIIDW
ncbi:hypothetical protein F5Y10DRAFT_261929 [Nemania abortiva]|nr:hypothetical protein F5Y10DRAFT_261929 [Nemania abortiva]